MLRNLAYQLAVAIPALRPAYESATPAAELIGDDGDSVERAFNMLLLGPLQKIESQLPANVVILIDALDECDGATAWSNLVLKLLREHLSKLPANVRFVITTRPEPHITSVLQQHFQPFSIKKNDPRHQKDLSDLITSTVEPLLASPGDLDAAVRLLLDRSEGTFVYIARALDSLEGGQSWTLSALRDFLPVGMNGMFKTYFEKAWHQMKSDKHEEVTVMLGLLAVSFEPPSIQQLAAWTKQLPATVRNTLKKCLGSLFIISPDDRVNGFHKSIYDWLCDRNTPEMYRVNVAPAHQRIGAASVGTMSDPTFDRRVPCFLHLLVVLLTNKTSTSQCGPRICPALHRGARLPSE